MNIVTLSISVLTGYYITGEEKGHEDRVKDLYDQLELEVKHTSIKEANERWTTVTSGSLVVVEM